MRNTSYIFSAGVMYWRFDNNKKNIKWNYFKNKDLLMRREMNKKAILKNYLGWSPAWFDLRKKEILKDNIDIEQWQINMNYLVWKYGSIDKSEQKAFKDWVIMNFKNTDNQDETSRQEVEALGVLPLSSLSYYYSMIEEYLEGKVTPVLTYISDGNLAPVFYNDQDRNWFLAAYPDVFDYFCTQVNYKNDDFDKEMLRVEKHTVQTRDEFERMEKYVSTGKSNQTIDLIRMKNFYLYELNKKLLLRDYFKRGSDIEQKKSHIKEDIVKENSIICPKCGYSSRSKEFSTCPKCGVIIKKYFEVQRKRFKNTPEQLIEKKEFDSEDKLKAKNSLFSTQPTDLKWGGYTLILFGVVNIIIGFFGIFGATIFHFIAGLMLLGLGFGALKHSSFLYIGTIIWSLGFVIFCINYFTDSLTQRYPAALIRVCV